MTSFRTPTRFSLFEQKNYFCSHIAEFFSQKTFGDIGPPCIMFYQKIVFFIAISFYSIFKSDKNEIHELIFRDISKGHK
jgi:hypothetical protein